MTGNLVLALVIMTGCGLTLDPTPPRQTSSMDAGQLRDGGVARDVSPDDSTVYLDAAGPCPVCQIPMGEMCVPAADGDSCPGGTCAAGSCCTGCVDAAGTCLSGNASSACGLVGQMCTACGAGQRCVRGMCEEAARITGGDEHTCYLTSGQLWCWGANDDGQLGLGSGISPLEPMLVPWIEAWVYVDAGSRHTCAIDESSRLHCWGANGFGQLGDGTTEGRLGPTRVGTETGWVTVSAGDAHTCGVRGDQLYCWGRMSEGQLGLGPPATEFEPVPTAAGFTAFRRVAAGRAHSCGIQGNRQVACWGEGSLGQLGMGPGTPLVDVPRSLMPALVANLIETYDSHSCVVGDAPRGVSCWGDNFAGAIGLPPDTNIVEVPTPIGALTGVSAIAVGVHHSCAIQGGVLHCWGLNEDGQLGLGHRTNTRQALRVGSAGGWNLIGAGAHHTCGRIGTDVLCWGLNDRGQAVGSAIDNRLTTPQVVTFP